MGFVMSAVAAAGTAPPVMTITGTPNQYIRLRIECTTAGPYDADPLLSWVLRYSTDGGTTWAEEDVPATATHVLLNADAVSTGLTLHIAATPASLDNVWTAATSEVSKLNPKVDIFDPIAAYIASVTGIRSYFGAGALAGNNAPPRFVWVPTVGSPSGPTAVGGEPRSLADVAMTFEVHCWGADFDLAWNMAALLATCVREFVTANYELGQFDALPTEANLKGWVITVPLQITLPLYEVTGDLASYVKAQATIARIDSSQGVDPDGTLTAPLA